MFIMQKLQIETEMAVRKKYKTGTPMILLVFAMKSAEASITLMAILS